MKRFRKLFALLLALGCCLALLPVSAMAENFTYVKGTGMDLKIPLNDDDGRKNYEDYLRTLKFIEFACNESLEYYDLYQNEGFGFYFTKNKKYLLIYSYFLESISDGTYHFSASSSLFDEINFADYHIIVKSAVADWPPATPTDLGGSDEPDEVLYIGGMKGAGVAETKGGKPADSKAAAAVSAVQAQQVVILPENAPAANPATGASI